MINYPKKNLTWQQFFCCCKFRNENIKVLLPGIFFTFYFAAHCNKDATTAQLPAITQEGKNTFGCKVGGKIWVPYHQCHSLGNGIEISTSINSVYDYKTLPVSLQLRAENYRDQKSEFNIDVSRSLSFIYNTGNVIDSLDISFTPDPLALHYQVRRYIPGNPQYFTITKLDTVNKIISGIFSFTVYARNQSDQNQFDSIIISDGRFDLQFGDRVHCSD